jgi:hypothetical protein
MLVHLIPPLVILSIYAFGVLVDRCIHQRSPLPVFERLLPNDISNRATVGLLLALPAIFLGAYLFAHFVVSLIASIFVSPPLLWLFLVASFSLQGLVAVLGCIACYTLYLLPFEMLQIDGNIRYIQAAQIEPALSHQWLKTVWLVSHLNPNSHLHEQAIDEIERAVNDVVVEQIGLCST